MGTWPQPFVYTSSLAAFILQQPSSCDRDASVCRISLSGPLWKVCQTLPYTLTCNCTLFFISLYLQMWQSTFLFYCWRTSGLWPVWGYYRQCFKYSFLLTEGCASLEIAFIYGLLMVNFLSENLFLKDIFAECKSLGCQLYFPQYITPMSLAPIVKNSAFIYNCCFFEDNKYIVSGCIKNLLTLLCVYAVLP